MTTVCGAGKFFWGRRPTQKGVAMDRASSRSSRRASLRSSRRAVARLSARAYEERKDDAGIYKELDDGLNPRKVFDDDGQILGYRPAPGEVGIVLPQEPEWCYGFVKDGDLSQPQPIIDNDGQLKAGQTYEETDGVARIRDDRGTVLQEWKKDECVIM